jgi:hypothetical protein
MNATQYVAALRTDLKEAVGVIEALEQHDASKPRI